jgi:hypothetical protein
VGDRFQNDRQSQSWRVNGLIQNIYADIRLAGLPSCSKNVLDNVVTFLVVHQAEERVAEIMGNTLKPFIRWQSATPGIWSS